MAKKRNPLTKRAKQPAVAEPKSQPRKQEELKTIVDDICGLLVKESGNELPLDVISSKTGISSMELERLGGILQQLGVLEVVYPVNVFSKPVLKLKRILARQESETYNGKVMMEYGLSSENLPISVSIFDLKGETIDVYAVMRAPVGPYTEEYLKYVREELAKILPVKVEEISDPRFSAQLRARFFDSACVLLNRTLPGITTKVRDSLAELLLHSMYGLGNLELLMLDNWLEEIGVNGASKPISVYHRKFGWLKSNISIPTEEEIYNYATQIGRKSGRDITILSPIMDAHLVTGDRVAATLFPISTSGDTITIRRFARNPWTIVDFTDPSMNTLSTEMAAFLWTCIQYELNLLVAGGTASGKTSLLNTVSAFIPPTQRIISIEDTRELALPAYLNWNWLPLNTRNPNSEGVGGVEMLDLMVASLRMRPDRILVGEVRKRREAEVLFEAMHTGHAVCSTLHADSAAQVVRRLTTPPIDIPATDMEALHLIAIQHRDRRRGLRRTIEISEVVAGVGEKITINPIYRWKPRTDEFERSNASARVIDELNLLTGMTSDEIEDDINEKKKMLEWMRANDWRSVDDLGKLVGYYYKHHDEVVDAMKKQVQPKDLLERW